MKNLFIIMIFNLIPVTGFAQTIYKPLTPVEYVKPYNENRTLEKPSEIRNIKNDNKFISKIGLGGGPSFLRKDGKQFQGGGFYMQYILDKKIGFDGYFKGYEN